MKDAAIEILNHGDMQYSFTEQGRDDVDIVVKAVWVPAFMLPTSRYRRLGPSRPMVEGQISKHRD
jgi:hypothetical protein